MFLKQYLVIIWSVNGHGVKLFLYAHKFGCARKTNQPWLTNPPWSTPLSPFGSKWALKTFSSELPCHSSSICSRSQILKELKSQDSSRPLTSQSISLPAGVRAAAPSWQRFIRGGSAQPNYYIVRSFTPSLLEKQCLSNSEVFTQTSPRWSQGLGRNPTFLWVGDWETFLIWKDTRKLKT